MIETVSRLDILHSVGEKAVQRLGFVWTDDRHYTLVEVEEAVVEVVEKLFYDTVCILAGADNSTGEWTSEEDDIVNRHLAALAVIAHLSALTV